MDFCVKCGRESIYKEYLCRACYFEENEQEKDKDSEKNNEENNETKDNERNNDEAIVQLRNSNKDIMDYTAKRILKDDIEVQKVEWLDNGANIHLAHEGFANRLVHDLSENFGGQIKKNRTLITEDKQTCKRVYRMKYLFKQFPIREGEKFNYKGDEYKVLNVGKKVYAENTSTKEKRRLRFEDLERYNVF